MRRMSLTISLISHVCSGVTMNSLQKGLGQPARMAGGAQVEIGSHSMPFFTPSMRLQHALLILWCELGRGRTAFWRLWIEREAGDRCACVDAAPVWKTRPLEWPSAFGLIAKSLIELRCRRVLPGERDTLCFRPFWTRCLGRITCWRVGCRARGGEHPHDEHRRCRQRCL